MARVTPPRRKDRVFGNLRRRKLLRKSIPGAEAIAGFACLLALVLAAAWVASQRDNHDPAERDLSVEILLASKAPEQLYKPPTYRWYDPAQASGSTAAAPSLGPFPDSLLTGGWTADGRLQSFSPDTLYEKINGQAEQYLKFDFQHLDTVSLVHAESGLVIDLFLYDQGSFSNAFGLHAEQRGNKELRLDGALLYTRTSLGANAVMGSKLLHLIGSQPDPRLDAKIEDCLRAFADEAGALHSPEPLRVFRNGLGLPLESIAYTPTTAFQLGFAKRFWFGKPMPSEPARLFAHWADDAGEAETMKKRLRDAQAEEFELIEQDEEATLLRHRFLGTFLALGVQDRVLLGAEDQPDGTAALAQLAVLRDALSGKAAPELQEPTSNESSAPEVIEEPETGYDPEREEG